MFIAVVRRIRMKLWIKSSLSPWSIHTDDFKLDKRCNKIVSWHFFLSSITKGVDDLFIMNGMYSCTCRFHTSFDFLTFTRYIVHLRFVFMHSTKSFSLKNFTKLCIKIFFNLINPINAFEFDNEVNRYSL